MGVTFESLLNGSLTLLSSIIFRHHCTPRNSLSAISSARCIYVISTCEGQLAFSDFAMPRMLFESALC